MRQVAPINLPTTTLNTSTPASIAIKGKVLTVQRDINTFAMVVRQKTGAPYSYARLRVRGLLGFDGGISGSPGGCLPARDDIVSLTGVITAINYSVLLVTVQHISVLSDLQVFDLLQHTCHDL